MNQEVSFRWGHGLGDTIFFAHALPLWIKRGYKIQVQTFDDKAPIFESAGAEIITSSPNHHPYLYPPPAPLMDLIGDWVNNKTAFNLTAEPLPFIGTTEELWKEMIEVKLRLPVNDEHRNAVKNWFDKPFIIIHTKGNSNPERKNIGKDAERELYRKLLDNTDCDLLVLDWDNRNERINNKRVKHLTDDFRRINLYETIALYEKAELFIGIDSGPQYMAWFTDLPVLCLWPGGNPAWYSMPRNKTVNLVKKELYPEWMQKRRHNYNVIEYDDIESVVKQTKKVLSGINGKDLVLDWMIDKTRHPGQAEMFVDRHETFRRAFAHLKTKNNPVVLETSCIRDVEDWFNSHSTYIFGFFLQNHGGTLHSIDPRAASVEFACYWTEPFREHVNIYCDQFVHWIEKNDEGFDLVHFIRHNHEDVKLVLPHMKDDSMILFDETHWSRGKWDGKGAKAVQYLLEHGWRIEYSGYATLLSRSSH